jgi:hypothetical protein
VRHAWRRAYAHRGPSVRNRVNFPARVGDSVDTRVLLSSPRPSTLWDPLTTPSELAALSDRAAPPASGGAGWSPRCPRAVAVDRHHDHHDVRQSASPAPNRVAASEGTAPHGHSGNPSQWPVTPGFAQAGAGRRRAFPIKRFPVPAPTHGLLYHRGWRWEAGTRVVSSRGGIARLLRCRPSIRRASPVGPPARRRPPFAGTAPWRRRPAWLDAACAFRRGGVPLG